MSFQCLSPMLAIQENEGEKPIILHIDRESDYEHYLKILPSKFKLFLLPCGKCPNCLKRRSQEWTARLLKESESHKYNYFITLTYDDKNLKDINKRDLQLFLKRYRKKYNVALKYYILGEYGETTLRAHYHAIFFQDKPIRNLCFYANNLYISEEFSKIWNNGNCLISKQVNEKDIKYCVAYTNKKLGETKIVLMSKGLGLSFLYEKKEQIKEHNGFYLVNGYKQKPPTYFKRKLKESSDPGDKKYLQDLENERKPSVQVSGHYLGDLLSDLKKFSESVTFKGKGVF